MTKRPPFTFRTKLLVSHIGLVAVVLLVVSFVLERSLAADLEAQRDENLVEQAKGATEWVSSGRHPHRVAARLAKILQAEIDIFDGRGCIIGSSSRAEDEPELSNDFCVAPDEVAAARASGAGRAVRPRAGDRLLYVAVPADDDLVLRLAVSSREIEAPIAAMRQRLAIGAAVAGLGALLLGLLAAKLVSRPLRSMAEQADSIARGDYDMRFPPMAADEFGRLADALAALASQLKADMARIDKLENTRRDFIANLTHELRTPVAAIQGYAETLLQDNVDPAKAKQFVDMMHKYAQRISGLVDGLLHLAALEARTPEGPPREPVDLRVAALEIAQALEARARDNEVSIDVQIGEGFVSIGESTRIEQILENLVDNAVKYGRRGGRITLRATREDDRVTVRVSDDGPGIEAAHLQRIFERFYRIDAGRSRERGGAGLGLSIVKHLVESMGGTIRVESEVGRGTTFVVQLMADRGADVETGA